jgi:DNA repair exonuclease SbcCD ATPase subunit
VETTLIVAIALGSVLLLALLGWWITGRRRRKAVRLAESTRAELTASQQLASSLRLGEQEAAWSAAARSNRLERALVDLDKAEHESARLSADIEALSARVAAAESDLREATSREAESAAEIAQLSADLSAAARRAEDAQGQLAELRALETRLDTATENATRADELAQQLAAAQSELNTLRTQSGSGVIDDDSSQLRLEVVRLSAELERASASSDVDADRLRAERDDLQLRLDAVMSARDAEREAAAIEHVALLEARAALEAGSTEVTIQTTGDEDSARVAELEAQIAALEDRLSAGPSDESYAVFDAELRRRVGEAVETATGRLRSEVDHLRTVVAEKERIIQGHLLAGTPVSPVEPRPRAVITDIKGIGPKIAAILAEHGVREIADVMPVYPGRILDDDWIGQARRLL